MELQSQFPVCSDVLKEKQNPSGSSEVADQRPEGPEFVKILNGLKRKGADLNAFYSDGTPLHHAACAGWETEVNWLLRNGADPLIKVGSDSTIDALGIAVRTENLAVATAILKHYQRLLSAKSISEKQQEQIHGSVQAALQEDKSVSKGALEKLLLTLRWQLSADQWGKKFGELLCGRQPTAALDLLKAKPWNDGVPLEVAEVSWVCPLEPGDKVIAGAWLKETDIATWLALDAQLPTPLLLPLITTLPKGRESQELQAAVTRGLRAPWSSKETATVYFKAVLSRRDTPVGSEPALLRLIPAEQLQLVLNMPAPQTFPPISDHRLGKAALIHAYAWPVSDLEWLLKQLNPTDIKEAQPEVLSRWSSYADAGHWTALTPHLIAPLTLPYGYPEKLTYALWPKWKAMGAVPDEKSWTYWLNGVPLVDLPKALPMARTIKEANPNAWPTDADWASLLLRTTPENVLNFVAFAKTQRPELLPRFMDWALAPLSYGATPDAVALQIPRASRDIDDPWQRVRQLAALGFKSVHPRFLTNDVPDAALPIAGTDEAIKKGWALLPPTQAQLASTTSPTGTPWVKPQLTCRLQVDDALRSALADNEFADPVLEYAVPVQVKEFADCQWLFVGGRFQGTRSWTEHDFFEGTTERRTNAADGNRIATFWNTGQKRLIDSGLVPDNGELFTLQQSGQVEAWIVASGISDMNWRAEWNVFQARVQPDSTLVLTPLPEAHPARVRLIAQCGGDLVLDGCDALKSVLGNAEGAPQSELGGLAVFVDMYWPQEKQSFLTALLENDRAALNRMRHQGLFGHWLSEGLQSVSKASSLSLMEKRRRAAWVLASSNPASVYDDLTLASLVSWLPPEDWRPIVKVLGCYTREKLLQRDEVKQNHLLYRRLQVETNRFPCP